MADYWERQPTETVKSFAAFRHYRDAGDNRSLQSTADALGYKSMSMVEKWSAKHDWVRRVHSYDAWLDANALVVQQVGITQYHESVAASLNEQLIVMKSVIDLGLKRMLDEAMSGVEIDPMDIKRMVAAIGDVDTLHRRNAGLPTSYRSEVAEEPEFEKLKYYIGGDENVSET